MKFSLVKLVVLLTVLVSCKKERECECITTTTQQGIDPVTEIVSTGKIKKKDAASECNLSDFEYRDGDPNSGTTHKVIRDCSPK